MLTFISLFTHVKFKSKRKPAKGIILLLVFFFYPDFLFAKTDRDFFLDVELRATYDDNVFALSEQDINDFEKGTDSTVFKGINSISDIISETYLSLNHKKTGLTLNSEMYLYGKNSSLNNSGLGIQYTKKFPDKDNISVSLFYIPNLFAGYGREVTGVTTVSFREEEIDISKFSVQYDDNISQTWNIRYGAYIKNKDFNSPFDKYDTLISGAFIQPAIKLKNFTIKTRYDIEAARSKSINDPDVNNDSSYISHLFKLSVRNKVNYNLYIVTSYSYKLRSFITDLDTDINHFGKDDRTQSLSIALTYWFNDDMSLISELLRIKRRSDILSRYFNYTENIVSAGLLFYF